MTLSGPSLPAGIRDTGFDKPRFDAKAQTGVCHAKKLFDPACLHDGADFALRERSHGKWQAQTCCKNREGRGEDLHRPDAARAAPMFPRQAAGHPVPHRPAGRSKTARHVRPSLCRPQGIAASQMPRRRYPRAGRIGEADRRGRKIRAGHRRHRHLLQRDRACRCRAETQLALLSRVGRPCQACPVRDTLRRLFRAFLALRGLGLALEIAPDHAEIRAADEEGNGEIDHHGKGDQQAERHQLLVERCGG